MARLQHSLDNARADPEKDYHLAFELNRLFEEIERDGEISGNVEIELEDIDDNMYISDIYMLISDWYSDNNFESVNKAQSLLQASIDESLDKNWQNVAAEYYYQLIYLQSNLSGHDADTEISKAISFLKNHFDNVTSSIFMRIIDLIDKNLDNIDRDRKEELVDLLQDVKSDAHSTKSFDRERTYLRRLHNLKTRDDGDTTSIESDLIRTYRLEANLSDNDSSLMKADILRSGIDECGEYMDDQKKESWKKEALEAQRRGTEEEMAELDFKNISFSEYDGDMKEDLNEEMRNNMNLIVDFFKDVKERYDSRYALYCLLMSEGLMPDTTRMRLNSERFVFQKVFSRKVISPEYHTISKDPADSDSIPGNYQMHAVNQMNATVNALFRLIKEGHLNFRDFTLLLRFSNSLSPDTDAFLTESLLDLFDGNHVQSLFVSLPHIEGAIVDTLSSVGRTAYTSIEGGTQQRTLGGLFKETDDFNQDFTTYLQYRYTSREGMNLRNRAAHGQLRYVNANYLNSVMAIFDILKIIVTINSSAYLRIFGPPQHTISPPTNYGKNLDLSLYTDLNSQIVGYGGNEDGHSFVVVRKDWNEDQMTLFVDRGRISEYTIGDAEMSKEEISSKVDHMSEEYAKIPSGVEYEWLTDDKILNEISDIAQNLSTDGSSEVQKESVFEQARTKGIDESTARIAFDRLEEKDDIEQDDTTIWMTD